MLKELLLTSPLYYRHPFETGSGAHIATLQLSLLIGVGLVAAGKIWREHRLHDLVRLGLGLFIILAEISFVLYPVPLGTFGLDWCLPLHLCDATAIICGIALITKNQFAVEWSYYFGLSTTLVTTATPDMYWDFPHIEFICFFATHSIVTAAACYLVAGLGLRPRKGAWKCVYISALCYGVLIAGVNSFLDSNYLYLCYKPGVDSLFDILGPWPWYIVALNAILLVFLLTLSLAERPTSGPAGKDHESLTPSTSSPLYSIALCSAPVQLYRNDGSEAPEAA